MRASNTAKYTPILWWVCAVSKPRTENRQMWSLFEHRTSVKADALDFNHGPEVKAFGSQSVQSAAQEKHSDHFNFLQHLKLQNVHHLQLSGWHFRSFCRSGEIHFDGCASEICFLSATASREGRIAKRPLLSCAHTSMYVLRFPGDFFQHTTDIPGSRNGIPDTIIAPADPSCFEAHFRRRGWDGVALLVLWLVSTLLNILATPLHPWVLAQSRRQKINWGGKEISLLCCSFSDLKLQKLWQNAHVPAVHCFHEYNWAISLWFTGITHHVSRRSSTQSQSSEVFSTNEHLSALKFSWNMSPHLATPVSRNFFFRSLRVTIKRWGTSSWIPDFKPLVEFKYKWKMCIASPVLWLDNCWAVVARLFAARTTRPTQKFFRSSHITLSLTPFWHVSLAMSSSGHFCTSSRSAWACTPSWDSFQLTWTTSKGWIAIVSSLEWRGLVSLWTKHHQRPHKKRQTPFPSRLAFIFSMTYLMYIQLIRIRGLPSFSRFE